MATKYMKKSTATYYESIAAKAMFGDDSMDSVRKYRKIQEEKKRAQRMGKFYS